MEQNPVFRMCTFTGKNKIALCIPFKIHTVIHKLLCYLLGGTNHDVHRLFVIFIMSSLHGIFKIAVIIIIIEQHAHAALCQKGIRFIGILLGDEKNLVMLGQL